MKLKCPICDKEFDCTPSRLNRAKNPPCCSKECSSIQKKDLIDLNCTCDFCGKKFHKKPSYIAKCKYNYCSEECLGKHRSIIYQGINNPNAFCRITIGNKKLHCGYYWVYLPDHPFSTKDGYIREHRLVAEQHLLTLATSVEIKGEYYLSPDFDVHHKDGNKLNNDPGNLEIVTRSEHSKLHSDTVKKALEFYKINQ